MAGLRRERADAVRNRRAILDATRTLLADGGADAVTMDRVAAAAGVGKGTVFHRFGSRAGLLHALVAEPADTLLAAITAGPPPLGPGAEPAERLLAFFDAMATMFIENAEVMAAAYRTVAPHPRTAEFHAAWTAHLTTLLAQVRPDVDAEAVGGLLFGVFGTDYAVAAVRAGEGDRVRAAARELMVSVVSR